MLGSCQQVREIVNICGNGFWLSAMFLSVKGGIWNVSMSELKVLNVSNCSEWCGKSSAVAGKVWYMCGTVRWYSNMVSAMLYKCWEVQMSYLMVFG